MAYRHKLSCRLALLRDLFTLIVPLATAVTWQRPSAPLSGPTSRVEPRIVVPKTPPLDPTQQVTLIAPDGSETGDSPSVAEASTASGGTIAPDGVARADQAFGSLLAATTSVGAGSANWTAPCATGSTACW
jgi:hypothetical protein